MSALVASPRSPVRAKATTFPKGFWITKAITTVAALGLQLVGVYAALVTFGGWITFALYAVGGVAAVLQHAVVRRGNSCSLGD